MSMVKVDRSNSFSRMLRAARHGYFWSNDHRCFIRISDIGQERFLVELLGERVDPAKAGRGFRCWKEDGAGGASLLRASPALDRLRESGRIVEGYEVWMLNDDGERTDQSACGDRSWMAP